MLLVGAAFIAAVAVLAMVTMVGRDALEQRGTDRTVLAGSGEQNGALSAAERDTAAAQPSPGIRPAPAFMPRIAPGRTDLGDGVYAIRAGDTVQVHFDTPDGRTRRRDKFDRMLRTTLRQIYGEPMDTLLTAQTGNLLGPRDLLTEATVTGLRIPLPDDGGMLEIRPGTRPGQDGPLVVSYTAMVTR